MFVPDDESDTPTEQDYAALGRFILQEARRRHQIGLVTTTPPTPVTVEEAEVTTTVPAIRLRRTVRWNDRSKLGQRPTRGPVVSLDPSYIPPKSTRGRQRTKRGLTSAILLPMALDTLHRDILDQSGQKPRDIMADLAKMNEWMWQKHLNETLVHI